MVAVITACPAHTTGPAGCRRFRRGGFVADGSGTAAAYPVRTGSFQAPGEVAPGRGAVEQAGEAAGLVGAEDALLEDAEADPGPPPGPHHLLHVHGVEGEDVEV